ncbi:MAG: O-antigen ligase family protein [Clostridiales bacterium]|nr:O-antigen ligase family protein [Clostridiales bacterium]
MKKILYTDYYLILVCALVFLGWFYKNAPLGFGSAVVLFCIALLFADDIMPLTVNIFSAVLLIYSQDFSDYVYLWPLVIPLVGCFVFFLIKNGRHKFHFGKMFFPLMAVAYVMIIGGIGYAAKDDFIKSLPDILMIGISVPIVYILYNHYLKRDGNRDISTYFAKTMMYIGIVIALEVIVSMVRSNLSIAEWAFHTKYIDGSNRNDVATYLIITAAMTIYLATRYRQSWIFLAISLFQYFGLLLTFSRGAILFGAISGLLALVFSIIKAPNKKLHLLFVALTAVGVLIIYLILRKDVNAMIDTLLGRGMDSSERIKLYEEAWALFKEHPIFGVGKGYVGANIEPNAMGVYWFHSTIMQVLACMGVVGLVAYIYYYWVRLKILFAHINNSFNLFILAVWVGFEGYSLINPNTFMAYPFMMLIIVTTLLLERVQKDFD